MGKSSWEETKQYSLSLYYSQGNCRFKALIFFFFWLSNNPLFYWKKVLEKKEKAKDKNREEREKGWEREKGKEEKGKSFWCVKNSYDLVLKPFLVSSGHHHHCLYTYSLYLLRRPLSLVTETQREREIPKKKLSWFLGFSISCVSLGFLIFLELFALWVFWKDSEKGFFFFFVLKIQTWALWSLFYDSVFFSLGFWNWGI